MQSLRIIFTSIFMFSYLFLFGQLSTTQKEAIDKLFLDWNVPNHPGGSVGVMIGDKVVFSKGYGLASMEYHVPNSKSTLYNIASVSKQFTAMGIVLLDLEGKLSVDDDIRTHLPEIPDFGKVVTIRHMLHHTSGLRSLHALLGLAGWRGDDARSNQDIDRFLRTQKELNFDPGEEYLYCNTGFMLMANIIEKITGEAFPAWMKANIFEPLGLHNTYVEDDYSRIIPDNATSYYGNSRNGFSRAVEYWGYVGSGNVHSSTDDILKWLSNFYAPHDGWKQAFDKLQTTDNFNNGKMNNYAFGVSVNNLQGHKIVSHSGAIGGFRAFASSYPEDKISIAILSNFSASSVGGKEREIAKILLDLPEEKDDTKSPDPPEASINMKSKQLKAFEGAFWSDKFNLLRMLKVENDTLRYIRSDDSKSKLIPIADHKFVMVHPSIDVIVEFGTENGSKTMDVIEESGITEFAEYQIRQSTLEDLREYAGEYFSPELKSSYFLYIKNGELVGEHPKHGVFDVHELKLDVLEADYPFSIAKIVRNTEGEISGVRVSNGRVRNLWFEKRH